MTNLEEFPALRAS